MIKKHTFTVLKRSKTVIEVSKKVIEDAAVLDHVV